MEAYDRKLQLRVARRMAMVKRMIEDQEAVLASLDPLEYVYRQEYLKALSTGRNKLYRLKQELHVLESGRLINGS